MTGEPADPKLTMDFEPRNLYVRRGSETHGRRDGGPSHDLQLDGEENKDDDLISVDDLDDGRNLVDSWISL